MSKQYEKKITWTIKNFSSLRSTKICSDVFVVGGCNWHLSAYPKGIKADNNLALYLNVSDHASLPSGWRRNARYLLTILNQNSQKSRKYSEIKHCFDETSKGQGYASMLSHNELHAKDGGFLVNDEVKIVVEIEVLEAIATLDITKEAYTLNVFEAIGTLDVTEETYTLTKTMNVNGFQLLPSQVKSVSLMFERHPDIASGFRPKNPKVKTAYMSFLLNLIEIMCQSPHELSTDDLSSASSAIEFLREEGFKLDWLDKTLDEVLEKKENEKVSETRLQAMEGELKDLKLKWSDMEELVKMEKAKVLAAKAPLSFDKVV